MDVNGVTTSALRSILQAQLAELSLTLPAQPPLRLFTHQNPLQAYEHLPFEAGLAAATVNSKGGNGYIIRSHLSNPVSTRPH